MTFPVFCGLHLVYGAVMAFTAERRMRAEGEVVGLPLLVTLVPVALVSAPIGALLARFAGPWFFQGVPVEGYAIEYERFHLGILLTVGVASCLFTLLGNFAAIAFLSRDARRVALVPIVIGLGLMTMTAVIDPAGVLQIDAERSVLTHPAGLLSLAVPLCLAGAFFYVKSRLSAPPALPY